MSHQFPPVADPELNYLYSLNNRGIKLGLERVTRALTHLGQPQSKYHAIHIAGTNGKGSTCAMLAAALQNTGRRVGLYTSPHLLNFHERIRVNQEPISDDYMRDFVRAARPLIENLSLTFFETTTILAMQYFAEQKVDWAVFETGMGGRLDATNLLTPQISVITPIGLDHQEYLGKRLLDIAAEKAGIGKVSVPCIIARQVPRLKKALLGMVAAQQAVPYYAPDVCRLRCTEETLQGQTIAYQFANGWRGEVKLPFIGAHQRLNCQTALATLFHLRTQIPDWAVALQGLANTVWAGRLQIISTQPLIFFDAGHNVHGIRAIVQTLQQMFPDQKIKFLLALGRAKKYQLVGKVLASVARRIYVTELEGYPSVPIEELHAALARYIEPERIVSDHSLRSQLNRACHELRANEILVILGSHYLAPVVFPYFQINV